MRTISAADQSLGPAASGAEFGGIDLDAVHIADSAFWKEGPEFRHAVFAELRAHDPVRHFPARTSEFSRPCTEFWALTRHVDVWNASRNPASYCSSITIDIEQTPEELGEFFPTMINLDDPEHARLRRLVSSGFTPKQVATLDDGLRSKASEIIDAVLDRYGDGAEFDFVVEVAARLPLQAIGTMMGVPDEDRRRAPELEITGEPERVLLMGLNAIKRLPALVSLG